MLDIIKYHYVSIFDVWRNDISGQVAAIYCEIKLIFAIKEKQPTLQHCKGKKAEKGGVGLQDSYFYFAKRYFSVLFSQRSAIQDYSSYPF